MKIISFITERQAIRAILDSVRRTGTPVSAGLAPPPARRSPGRDRGALSTGNRQQNTK